MVHYLGQEAVRWCSTNMLDTTSRQTRHLTLRGGTLRGGTCGGTLFIKKLNMVTHYLVTHYYIEAMQHYATALAPCILPCVQYMCNMCAIRMQYLCNTCAIQVQYVLLDSTAPPPGKRYTATSLRRKISEPRTLCC